MGEGPADLRLHSVLPGTFCLYGFRSHLEDLLPALSHLGNPCSELVLVGCWHMQRTLCSLGINTHTKFGTCMFLERFILSYADMYVMGSDDDDGSHDILACQMSFCLQGLTFTQIPHQGVC